MATACLTSIPRCSGVERGVRRAEPDDLDMVGRRVCARWHDGFWYMGTVKAVRYSRDSQTYCTVLFENDLTEELPSTLIVGVGFGVVDYAHLKPGQRVVACHVGVWVHAVVVSCYPDVGQMLVELANKERLRCAFEDVALCIDDNGAPPMLKRAKRNDDVLTQAKDKRIRPDCGLASSATSRIIAPVTTGVGAINHVHTSLDTSLTSAQAELAEPPDASRKSPSMTLAAVHHRPVRPAALESKDSEGIGLSLEEAAHPPLSTRPSAFSVVSLTSGDLGVASMETLPRRPLAVPSSIALRPAPVYDTHYGEGLPKVILPGNVSERSPRSVSLQSGYSKGPAPPSVQRSWASLPPPKCMVSPEHKTNTNMMHSYTHPLLRPYDYYPNEPPIYGDPSMVQRTESAATFSDEMGHDHESVFGDALRCPAPGCLAVFVNPRNLQRHMVAEHNDRHHGSHTLARRNTRDPAGALRAVANAPAATSIEYMKCRKRYGMYRKSEWCSKCRWKKKCERTPQIP